VSHLYRCYAGDGVLLYVGKARDVPARLEQHRVRKSWWAEVAKVDVEDAPWEELPAREIAAIRAEHPKYNVVNNRDRLDRRQLNIWVDKDLAARVKILAAQQETTIEEWVTTAIEMRLGIK
jgi:predicted GIY-YIG superfamily endonuclease